jgi:hypothetical protein
MQLRILKCNSSLWTMTVSLLVVMRRAAQCNAYAAWPTIRRKIASGRGPLKVVFTPRGSIQPSQGTNGGFRTSSALTESISKTVLFDTTSDMQAEQPTSSTFQNEDLTDTTIDNNNVILRDLNPSQIRAVMQPLEGITRVVAGPGTVFHVASLIYQVFLNKVLTSLTTSIISCRKRQNASFDLSYCTALDNRLRSGVGGDVYAKGCWRNATTS